VEYCYSSLDDDGDSWERTLVVDIVVVVAAVAVVAVVVKEEVRMEEKKKKTTKLDNKAAVDGDNSADKASASRNDGYYCDVDGYYFYKTYRHH
jgi:hypothetical protein